MTIINHINYSNSLWFFLHFYCLNYSLNFTGKTILKYFDLLLAETLLLNCWPARRQPCWACSAKPDSELTNFRFQVTFTNSFTWFIAKMLSGIRADGQPATPRQ